MLVGTVRSCVLRNSLKEIEFNHISILVMFIDKSRLLWVIVICLDDALWQIRQTVAHPEIRLITME